MSGMDLERLAAVEPAVDAARVEEELQAWLDGNDNEAVRAPWKITSIGAADWAIQRVADCKRRVAEYDDQIALWQRARERVDAAGDWLEDRLKEWAIEQRSPQRKSFPLAHGTIGTREQKSKIEVADEHLALAWAKIMAPDAVKVKESFLISQVGDAAKIAEVVVGLESTNKQTGDLERLPIPAGMTLAAVEAIREKLGDGYVVDCVTELRVLDTDGRPVPGLVVTPAKVTANVTPLL